MKIRESSARIIINQVDRDTLHNFKCYPNYIHYTQNLYIVLDYLKENQQFEKILIKKDNEFITQEIMKYQKNLGVIKFE